MVLPAGSRRTQNPGQRDLKFCIHYRYETQKAILTDIVSSLHHQGLRRLLIVNGHGGNSFKPMIRDLAVDFPDMTIAVSDWFTVLPARLVRTSRRPCRRTRDIGDDALSPPVWSTSPQQAPARRAPLPPNHFNAKRHGSRATGSKVSDDTGIGDPSLSTAEKAPPTSLP